MVNKPKPKIMVFVIALRLKIFDEADSTTSLRWSVEEETFPFDLASSDTTSNRLVVRLKITLKILFIIYDLFYKIYLLLKYKKFGSRILTK